jgi:signal peptidase I
MSDPSSRTLATPITSTVPPQHSSETKRHLLAALFSAFAPGAGQLFLGQRRKGILLTIALAVLIFGVFPLRLPRSLVAFDLIVLSWLGLSIYSSCAALLEPDNSAIPRLSVWWFLLIPPLVYAGFNSVFTPIFLGSGFRALKFESSAMESTLLIGGHFIIDKDSYRYHPPARNDLVVMHRNDYQTVKRVIALSGDTIEGRNRQILLNGQAVGEPFIQHKLPIGSNPEQDSFGPVTIPAGKYFVMGDNRDVSLDSRAQDFGLVDAQAITGRPLYIYRSPTGGRVGKRLY